MASQLLSALRRALADPDEIIRKAGAPLLAGAQRNVQAMGLVRTGRLYASLAEGHPDNVSEVSGSTGAYGTSVPYAALVADGTSRMPARNFLALSDHTVDAAVDAAMDALFEDL